MTATATPTPTPTKPHTAHRTRIWPAMTSLAALLILAATARMLMGTSGFGIPDDLPADALAAIWQARAFRLALAIVAGAALAVSGVALQALLRNALAEPYILGLSTGAAAGIMAQGVAFYYLGWSIGAHSVALDAPMRWLGLSDGAAFMQLKFSPDQVAALLGATLSMLIVFLASRRRGLVDPLGLLLTGVVLSTINGALVMMLNYLAGPGGVRDDLARWMMGYLDSGVSGGMVGAIALLTLGGIVVLALSGRSMDIAALTETESQSLGVNLARLRTVLFATASLLAAGAVLLAGPLAFVGLICPHVARLMLGPRHGPLVIGSAMAGAALILLADVASAALATTTGIGMMPIGIFTAMVGGPVFLWMLHPQLGRGAE